MKKNGFTLIELLAAIVILSFILAIAIPSMRDTIQGSKDKAYTIAVEQIKKAAKSYTVDNVNDIENLKETGTGRIFLKTLMDAGYLEKNIKNPKTDSAFAEESFITVNILSNGAYQYIYPGE